MVAGWSQVDVCRFVRFLSFLIGITFNSEGWEIDKCGFSKE